MNPNNSEPSESSESSESDYNSGSTKSNELEPNSESSESSDGFFELKDNLIEGLSNGERFAITNFVIGLLSPQDQDINFNTTINNDFILQHPQYPFCRLLTTNEGAISIAEYIAVISLDIRDIQINDNLTTANLNSVLQAIEHRLKEGGALNSLAIINNWGYEANAGTTESLLNIINLPNRPRSINILNSNIDANNLINTLLDSGLVIEGRNDLVIYANVAPALALQPLNQALQPSNILISQEANDDHRGYQDNQRIPNLREIADTLHNALRSVNNGALFNFIEASHDIDQRIPRVNWLVLGLINLNDYPNLSTTILDSVRNEGENLIINRNDLTANSTNLILQGILDGLNAENPQFQELRSLQISNNVSDGDNIAMNEESMNLLSDIMLHPHNRVRNLDIRNNNINPDHLNIFLDRNADNQNLLAFNFSYNLINQASVELLNRILENNLNINIEADYSVPEGVELGNLVNHPHLNPGFELQVPMNQFAPSNSSRGSLNSSLLDLSNDNQL